MSASKYRAKAREALNGKWSKGVLIVLAYMLFVFLIKLVEDTIQPTYQSCIIVIALLAISVPISFGLVFAFRIGFEVF